MDIHEMEGYRQGERRIWYCPICGRRVVLIPNAGNDIIEKGDQTAQHHQPLSLTAMLEERMPDSFAQWAEENAERLFEADYPSP